MNRLSKKGKNFILSSLGYRLYEEYFKSVSKDSDWGKLHDISGNITEVEATDSFSTFALVNSSDDKYGQRLLLTDVDLDKITGHTLQKVSEWRLNKARAQRIYYLSLCNMDKRLDYLLSLDKVKSPNLKPIEFRQINGEITYDYKDYGYETRYSDGLVSRDELIEGGIYAKIGKYHRSILCLAPMPDSAGSLDVIVTSCFSHQLSVIPRNFKFKNISVQTSFVKSVFGAIDKFGNKKAKVIAKRNVCGAVGVGDRDFERFLELYKAGVRSFRLYSIATDSRIILMAKKLIDEISKMSSRVNPIELFVGQITSKTQFDELYIKLGKKRWKYIDGFYIGNGGGSRCKTAETGMKVNTPQLSYFLRNSKVLYGKSIIVEGGVGNEPATALLLGASGLSYSAGITGGSIEAPGGALFISDGKGYWKPYRGEASPSAKIIEGHIYPTGDAKQVEGANGFIRMEKKYPSMCGRILNINEWIAQCFVKLGVKNIDQLHALGVTMKKEEVVEIFGKKPSEIHDLIKVKGKYKIAFPLGLRSEAQRNVAKAYGVGDKIQASEALDIDYTHRII